MFALMVFCWPASGQTPDALKQAQQRLTIELEAAKKEASDLKKTVAAGEVRTAGRIAAIQGEADRDRAANAAEIRQLKLDLVNSQGSVAARDRALAEIKKNIKRRAVWRILTFRW